MTLRREVAATPETFRSLGNRMLMMQEIKTYLAPRNLVEALKAMAAGDVTVVCGGTDLAPQTESGVRRYSATLMNI
ncbi:MAG: hypothetical protein IT540_02500, partial [Hyphomicrobium sp.]|nr:hypothetical protein [Hyphomicrobium sp.]